MELPRTRSLGDVASEWKADSKEKNLPPSGSGESTSERQGTREKSENFEKLSKARSMRRGSGAGSPNSLLSIPRCPAFDFGEQEDAHSLFPSPSEPEGYQSIKPEMPREKSTADAVQSSSQLSETSQKKKDTNKLKTLMPELMENSETESAKGSFECEPSDVTFNLEASVAPLSDIAFPSLPNTFLAKLGVHKDSPLSNVSAFDEQELESKFVALSLAFKTDRNTLNKRIELHKRQRDMAEKNVENEFHAMREHLNTLNLKAVGSDIRDLISKIQNHLDIAQQATSRLSGRAEIYGSVQQEERVSRAFEVLVLHVDHLKRLFDKEHKELEETRKMLTDTHAFRKELGADTITEDQKKYLKSFALPIGTIKSIGKRRASVADFHQYSLTEGFRPQNLSLSWSSGFGTQKEIKHSSCLLPSVSSLGLSSDSLPPSSATSSNPSRICIKETRARRSSLPAANSTIPSILPSPESSSEDLSHTALSLDKRCLRKKERKNWTRKLSSVTDEKELSEEEEGEKPLDVTVKENAEYETETRDVKLIFLKQVESKINDSYKNFNESFKDTATSEESCFTPEIHKTDDSTPEKNLCFDDWPGISILHGLWEENNAWTSVRLISSTLFIFVAFCIFLFSLIIPCLSGSIFSDELGDCINVIFNIRPQKHNPSL